MPDEIFLGATIFLLLELGEELTPDMWLVQAHKHEAQVLIVIVNFKEN